MAGWRATSSAVEALALGDARSVFLVGGGGKTSLLALLARELGQRERALATTSTRILGREAAAIGELLVEHELPRLAARLAARGAAGWPVVVARGRGEGDKLAGFSAAELDALRDAGVAERLLVEADGSAGRSLKAHAAHEPVVSARAELLVAVVGADCLGRPLTDEHVHRAERLRALLGRPAAHRITPADVAAIVLHESAGYLRTAAPATRVALLISKARSGEQQRQAQGLALALRAADVRRRIATIAVGELSGTPLLQTLAE